MILVTAGVIERNNKYLIARRKKGEHLEGKWEFPGGKVKSFETPEECLRRELKEEFSISVEVKEFIGSSIYHYETISINLLAYKVNYLSGNFCLKDHDKIVWISLEEFDNYNFADADLPIIELVKTNGGSSYMNSNIDRKVNFDSGLSKGQVISNEELYELFKCSPQGGMRRSKSTNSLVLISKKIKGDESIYHDRIKGDGFYHYTGMGQIGNQSLNFMQNKTLAESNYNGVNCFLFEVYKPKKYTFIGKVILASDPYQEEQLDAEDKKRKVWVFPLEILD